MFRIFCKSLQIHPLDEPARNIWQLYADGDELKDSYLFTPSAYNYLLYHFSQNSAMESPILYVMTHRPLRVFTLRKVS